ncbi:MAG: NAD(P)-binding protein [Gemmataceae bacterium]
MIHPNVERNRIGVIGNGLAGLSAACVLAARRYQVVVFEKSPGSAARRPC